MALLMALAMALLKALLKALLMALMAIQMDLLMTLQHTYVCAYVSVRHSWPRVPSGARLYIHRPRAPEAPRPCPPARASC